MLGEVDQLVRVGRRLVGFLHQPLRHVDQAAPERLFLHDLRVVLDVRRRGDCVQQDADVLATARRLQGTLAFQFLGERDRVHHRPVLVQRQRRLEDPPVALAVEHRLVHELDGARDGFGVEQHGREHGHLGVLRIRGTPVT